MIMIGIAYTRLNLIMYAGAFMFLICSYESNKLLTHETESAAT